MRSLTQTLVLHPTPLILPRSLMTARPLDICLCTMDFVGPVRNGGIGTAYHALAYALKNAGHRVTVLYALGQWCERGNVQQWTEHYRKQGIDFIPVPDHTEGLVSASPSVKASYEVYRWLAAQEKSGRQFDIIHFHEWRGVGFHSTLAKHQGLALRNSVLCIGTHSPASWHRWGMGEFTSNIEQLQIDHIERTALELADVVISPSAYMLDWIRQQGWTLPTDTSVRQNILVDCLPAEKLSNPQRSAIKELVFFGRLETRKGLVLFCDALDLLSKEISPDQFSVVLLGKKSVVDGIETGAYLESRSRNWKFSWRIVSDLDRAGAFEFLQKPGRLAVIPSLLENSPYTLFECIGNGLTCICSDLPGNRELIAPADADRACFALKPAALAAKLKDAILNGAVAPLPAIHPDETKSQWLAWHQAIAGKHVGPASSSDKPLVSICMAHRNRPKLLQQAIESVRQQDYPNFELILVDDGSDKPDAIEYLASLEQEFKQPNWQLIRQPNKYLGAARNTAARAARGDWLLFMDDDNIALPHELSTFIRAAQASKADILTCAVAGFRGDDAPDTSQTPHYLWLPLGGAVAVGLFSNQYGDANALFRKSVFEKLGGFTEDYGTGHEDWEIFAKASLAGYTVQMVPEILFWYRVGAASMLRTTSLFVNHMRNLRPYEAAVHPDLCPVLQYAQSMFLHPQSQIDLAPPPPPTPAPVETVKPMEPIDPVGPQKLVDDYWNSLSWRLSGIVRSILYKICRMPKPQKPLVSTQREAFVAVEHIRRSISWEATGPLRAVGRVYFAIRAWKRGNGNAK